MKWIIYCLLAALFWSFNVAICKKNNKINPLILNTAQFLIMMPVCILLFFIFDINLYIIPLQGLFVIILLALLNILFISLGIYAIHISGIGLTQPFLSITPLFQLLTSFIILKEIPSLYGILGVVFVIIGVYLVNIQKFHEGLFEPLKSVIKEKGSLIMLLVALGYSINGNLFKIGSQFLPRIQFIVVLMMFEAIIGLLFVLVNFRKSVIKTFKFKKNYLNYLLLGLSMFLSEIFFVFGINKTLVPYATAVKRTGIVFSVVFGYLFFKEKNFKETITGSIIMLLGVIVISLLG
ncbi:DMT family transporter [Candidatus Woesearchaeota archaeon]|nr:DMT family transporter [Candidatus Woesearchaeota archaeon]